MIVQVASPEKSVEANITINYHKIIIIFVSITALSVGTLTSLNGNNIRSGTQRDCITYFSKLNTKFIINLISKFQVIQVEKQAEEELNVATKVAEEHADKPSRKNPLQFEKPQEGSIKYNRHTEHSVQYQYSKQTLPRAIELPKHKGGENKCADCQISFSQVTTYISKLIYQQDVDAIKHGV